MSPHGIMTASLAPRSRLRAAASVPGISIPAGARLQHQETNLHANSLASTIFSTTSVVDSGFVVDLGVYSAPDQPHNPDLPRSSGYRTQHRALEGHETHGPQQ